VLLQKKVQGWRGQRLANSRVIRTAREWMLAGWKNWIIQTWELFEGWIPTCSVLHCFQQNLPRSALPASCAQARPFSTTVLSAAFLQLALLRAGSLEPKHRLIWVYDYQAEPPNPAAVERSKEKARPETPVFRA